MIVARAIGRFEIKHIVTDKPFVAAMVKDMADVPPTTFQQAADISTAATQLWQCMQQVKDLAGKLYSHAGPIGEFCTMHIVFTLSMCMAQHKEAVNTIAFSLDARCFPMHISFLHLQYNAMQ